VSDPRNDPRAHDLLAADPSEVVTLATVFGTVAAQAEQLSGNVVAGTPGGVWSGGAADAFRAALGKLPGELQKVIESYRQAAGALDRYEGELSSLQSQFRSIASQLATAESQLAGAQGALQHAQQAYDTASARTLLSHPTMPLPSTFTASPSNPALQTAVDAASGAVGRAQGEISQLSGQGYRLLDEFDGARGAARGSVSSASAVSPQRSGWDSFLHDVGNFFGAAGGFLLHVGESIGHSVIDTVPALINLAEHPSWESLGRLAEDVAVTGGVVAMAVFPFDAPMLVALGEGGEAVAGGATSVKALADLGQGHYADASVDLLFADLPKVDDLAGVGAQQVHEASAVEDALRTYDDFRLSGANPGEALSGLTDAQRQIHNLSSAEQTGSAVERAGLTRENAERAARLIGRPLAFSAEHLIEDPAQEHAKQTLEQLLHPEPCAG
jgi:hypothetical protein